MQRSPVAIGTILVVIITGLAGADYWFKERPILQQSTEISPEIPIAPTAQSSSSESSQSSLSSIPSISSSSQAGTPASSSSPQAETAAPRVVKKGISTKKKAAVNVDDVIARLGLARQPTNEASFLSLMMPNGTGAETTVLLWHDDRAFLMSWLENSDVKTIFGNLKQGLQEQFSSKLSDLRDETITVPDGPPVNILSFVDPALSSERLIFLRVRTRLYEIHVAKNGETIVDQLMAELSK